MYGSCIIGNVTENWNLFDEWFNNLCLKLPQIVSSEEMYYLLTSYLERTNHDIVQFEDIEDVKYFVLNEIVNPRPHYHVRELAVGNPSKTKVGLNMMVIELIISNKRKRLLQISTDEAGVLAWSGFWVQSLGRPHVIYQELWVPWFDSDEDEEIEE